MRRRCLLKIKSVWVMGNRKITYCQAVLHTKYIDR